MTSTNNKGVLTLTFHHYRRGDGKSMLCYAENPRPSLAAAHFCVDLTDADDHYLVCKLLRPTVLRLMQHDRISAKNCFIRLEDDTKNMPRTTSWVSRNKLTCYVTLR